ncbi:MAG: MFS transporter, partial [Bacteroidetes bacterium]
GLIESPKSGFGHLSIVLPLLIGGLSLIAFIVVQKYSKNPMMPLGLFKSATFSGGNLLTLFVYAALGGTMFFLPLNLIQVQGYSELKAGLAMLPMVILIAGISSIIGKFVDRRGVRIPLIIGPIITSAGFFMFSTFSITSGPQDYWETFFISFLLMGTGMGITVAPLTTAVMGAVSHNSVGIASGINNTVARAAGLLAVALMGALVLFTFKKSVANELGLMDIPNHMRDQIMIESSKFAAAEAPTSLSEENQIAVTKLLKDSFILAFNKAIYVASILTLLGGFMALLMIRHKK